VTNTPVYPSIQTSIILQTIFERYADVEKILVAPKPKKTFETEEDGEDRDGANDASSLVEDLTLKMFENEIRSFGAKKTTLDEETWCDQGRYAHVILKSSKDMKQILKTFQRKNNVKNKKNAKEQQTTIVRISKLEIQELQDISHERFLLYKKQILLQQHGSWQSNETNVIDDNEADDTQHEEPSGVMTLARSHRDKIFPRDTLQNICNHIMEKYEHAESVALRKQQEAMNQPDEDGFVTVSYSTSVGDAIQLEQNGKLGSTGGGGRRKRERTRSVKKNVFKGSDELPDFYRFQLKENKKRSMEELKNRFQEDLKRVKQMKDEKLFRPF
jgi:ribosomal RNA-processing protein 7